mgnify:CR=1 FL=1
MSFTRTLRPATPKEKQSLIANGERLKSDTGTVEVLTVEVNRFAVGQECNDEGPILFFELTQNELLVLWGQWLYDPHVVTTELPDIGGLWERNAWFKQFELVRSSSSGVVLSLKSIGYETVNSVGTISAGQRLPAQPSGVFQGTLDTLVNQQ